MRRMSGLKDSRTYSLTPQQNPRVEIRRKCRVEGFDLVLLDDAHVLRYSTHVHLAHVIKVNSGPLPGWQVSLRHVLVPHHFPIRIGDGHGFGYQLNDCVYAILLAGAGIGSMRQSCVDFAGILDVIRREDCNISQGNIAHIFASP